MRDELLNRELFDTLDEAKVLTERWRHEYNRIRPHSALGYRPPAPEAIEPMPSGFAPFRPPALASGVTSFSSGTSATSRWQKVAEVPEEKLEEHIASMRESRGEITTNGVLRLAGELKRDVYLDWRDKVIDPLTEEQAAMLRGYVAWKIMNWRAMEEADEARREADHLETARNVGKAIRRHHRRKKKRLSARP
jgi:hypothetical protein